MRRKRRRLVLLNVGLALVLVVVAGGVYLLVFGPDDANSAAAGVRTYRAARATVESTVTATGAVQPGRSANVDFGTSGTVQKIDVAVGDTVAKGDVLARLDGSAQRQAVTAARSRLDAAEQALAELEDEETCDDSASSPAGSNGSTGANDTGGGNGQSACKTEAQLASAEADVDAARSDLDQAKADRAATKLTAPMAGTVVAVNGTVGSSSSASSGSGSSGSGSNGSGSDSSTSSTGSLDTDSGFVVIADMHHLVVDVSLAEADVTKVKKGQRVTVTFPALTGGQAKGRVTSIDLAGTTTNNVVTYGVRVNLASVPKGLRLGQTADVSIVTARAAGVLSVPSVAVHTAGGTPTVRVLQNGKVVTKPVQTGIEGTQMTQITSGLKVGDEVVIVTAGQASRAASTQNGQLDGGFGGQKGPVTGGTGPKLVRRP